MPSSRGAAGLKVVNSRFIANRCDRTGPDLGGAAIRALSEYHGLCTGTLRIEQSKLHHNPSAGFETAGYPGIFFLGRGHPIVTGSTLS